MDTNALPADSSGEVSQNTQSPTPQVDVSAPSALGTDPKLLQAAAAQKVEAAILETTTSPVERALQIHAIKAEYLKTAYNIDINSQKNA